MVALIKNVQIISYLIVALICIHILTWCTYFIQQLGMVTLVTSTVYIRT